MGESMLSIHLGGVGQDDSLRELSNCVAEARVLGRKFEVQLRR
jgi:hypothetical protein